MQRVFDLTMARAELQCLHDLRTNLGDTLAGHALQLKTVGTLLPDDVLDRLTQYRSRLLQLATNLSSNKPTANVEISEALSLDSITAAVSSTELRSRGERTLRPVLNLKHVDDANFLPLESCQAEARQLLSEADSNDCAWSSDVLDARLQPFEALMALESETSQLSDEEWSACQEQVAAAWGRPLSTALTRGKIRSMPAVEESVPEDNASTTSAEIDQGSTVWIQPLFKVAEVATPELPAVTLLNATDAGLAESQQQTTEFALSQKSVVEPTPDHQIRSTDVVGSANGNNHLPMENDQSAAPTTLQSNNDIRRLAARALDANPHERSTYISELVLELLVIDQPAIAFQLGSRVNGLDSNCPAPWLIHALALSPHLCYAHGEIARQVEHDLEKFRPDPMNTPSSDADPANGFLLRAASLMPALLSASPAATQIFKSFRISPELSRTYNYCSRIATYGQEFQGQAPDLFTPDCGSADWEAKLQRLQQSVEQWLPQLIDRYCAVSQAPQIYLHANWTLTASTAARQELAANYWRKWQEVLRLVAGVLSPIRNDDASERNWVKLEVQRLSENVRLEVPTELQVGNLPVGVMLFPDESMLAVIREGMALANRWLRLCAAKPGEGRMLAIRSGQALRDEIVERTDGVIAELAAYGQAHDSLETRAGVAGLCRVIEQLRTILSPQSTLPLRESDPKTILNRGLSNISGIDTAAEMNSEAASNEFVQAILRFLSDAKADGARREKLPAGFGFHSRDRLELHPITGRTQQESLRLRIATELTRCCHE